MLAWGNTCKRAAYQKLPGGNRPAQRSRSVKETKSKGHEAQVIEGSKGAKAQGGQETWRQGNQVYTPKTQSVGHVWSYRALTERGADAYTRHLRPHGHPYLRLGEL